MAFLRFIVLIGILAPVCIGNEIPKLIEASDEDFNTQKLVEAWVEIWNTYDLDQVEKLFLQDERVTYFSSEKEGAVTGIDAVREHHRGFGFVEGGKVQPNKLWVEDLQTSAFVETVVVTGIWFFQRPDDSVQRGPVTIVYVKISEDYFIAHMHFANYLDEKNKEKSNT